MGYMLLYDNGLIKLTNYMYLGFPDTVHILSIISRDHLDYRGFPYGEGAD